MIHRIVFALALGAGGAAAAFALVPAGGVRSGVAPRPPEKIYAVNCGYCHGFNVGPVIRGRALPADAIAYVVRNGQGAMPAFRPTEVTNAELAALARWVSTSKADPKEHGQ